MQAVTLSPNLHQAIKTVKTIQSFQLEKLFSHKDFMNGLGLSANEEKALVNIFSEKESKGAVSQWY